jgi:hypothetical protein
MPPSDMLELIEIENTLVVEVVDHETQTEEVMGDDEELFGAPPCTPKNC